MSGEHESRLISPLQTRQQRKRRLFYSVPPLRNRARSCTACSLKAENCFHSCSPHRYLDPKLVSEIYKLRRDAAFVDSNTTRISIDGEVVASSAADAARMPVECDNNNEHNQSDNPENMSAAESEPLSPTREEISSLTTSENNQLPDQGSASDNEDPLVSAAMRAFAPATNANKLPCYNVPVSNRYQLLTPREKPAPTVATASGISTSNATSATNQNTAPARAPPQRPREAVGEIVLQQPVITTEILRALTPHITTPLRGNTTAAYFTLKPGCVRDHAKIIEILDTMKQFNRHAQFFFRRATSERRHRLVLRGLPGGVDTLEIKTEIESQGVPVHYVSEMKKAVYDVQGKAFQSLELYLIETDHSKISSLKCIRTLMQSVITWEEHRGSDRVPHCKRCQMWGHSHNGCRRNIVCMFCAEGHSFDECQRQEGDQPTCANCQGRHTANFGECPALINYKAVRAQRLAGARDSRSASDLARRANAFAGPRTALVQTAPTAASFPALSGLVTEAPTTAGTLFADVTAGRPTPAPRVPTPASTSTLGGLSEFSELLQLLRGINLSQILNIVKQAIQIFRGPGSILEKLTLILPLVETALND